MAKKPIKMAQKIIDNIKIAMDIKPPVVIEPLVIPPEVKKESNFITKDLKVVERLQDIFTIKNISYDPSTETRTFTFNATEEEINQFLK